MSSVTLLKAGACPAGPAVAATIARVNADAAARESIATLLRQRVEVRETTGAVYGSVDVRAPEGPLHRGLARTVSALELKIAHLRREMRQDFSAVTSAV